jgi:hypothetical protein
VKPHRKDGYRHRGRVHLRIDEQTLVGLDDLAEALGLSRSHVCDVILAIAVDDGGTWLQDSIGRRVRSALAKRRAGMERR